MCGHCKESWGAGEPRGRRLFYRRAEASSNIAAMIRRGVATLETSADATAGQPASCAICKIN